MYAKIMELSPFNSAANETNLGPSGEGERARETRAVQHASPYSRGEGLFKQHVVGEGESELGANFTQISRPCVIPFS